MAKNKRRLLSMAPYSHLNEDLMVEIMSRLPAKCLLRFKSISKRWKSIIEDPTFIALHHKRARSQSNGGSLLIFFHKLRLPNTEASDLLLFSAPYHGRPACPLLQNHPEFKGYITSPSTHGLILLYPESGRSIDKPVFVFNPTTRELVQLPPVEKNEGLLWVNYYLGFDPLSGVYKVLSLCNSSTQEKTGYYNQYNVLTLGSKEWMKLGTPNIPLVDQLAPYHSCCVNGAIYFRINSYQIHGFIVAFEVGEENFHLVSVPRAPSPMNLIMDVGGRLALREEDDVVWIMEDQNQEKWIRLKLQNPNGAEPYTILGGVHYSSNKFLLAPKYQIFAKDPWIVYWDNSEEEWSKFQITGLPDINFNSLPYCFMATNNIETLFSPSVGSTSMI